MATDSGSGSRTTSWLPVTTAFSAPADCASLIWGAHAPWLAVYDPGFGLSVDPSLTCLPPAATTWWEQNGSDSVVYSIGPTIVCPSAYTTATTSVTDSSTFVACCPNGYDLNTVADHGAAVQCQSYMTEGQVVTMVNFRTFTSNGGVASAWVTGTSTAGGASVVDGIQMNGWKFAATTTTAGSSSPNSTTGAAPTSVASKSSSTAASSDTSSPNIGAKQSSGLSTGAKAGIGVACGLVGLAIVAGAILYFVLRKRRENASVGSGELDKVANDYYEPPPPVQEMHAATWRAEMMTNGGHQDRAELEGNNFNDR